MATPNKKSVLGRGLGALIPRSSPKEMSVRRDHGSSGGSEHGTMANIDIARIRPNPFQPRIDFEKEALEADAGEPPTVPEDLVASILAAIKGEPGA